MAELSSILVDLFVIFLAANVAAELLERLGQPPVIGELLAGVLIGPHALGLIGAPGAALIGALHGEAGAAPAREVARGCPQTAQTSRLLCAFY